MSIAFKYVQYCKLCLRIILYHVKYLQVCAVFQIIFFFNDNFVSFTLKKLGNVETQLVM